MATDNKLPLAEASDTAQAQKFVSRSAQNNFRAGDAVKVHVKIVEGEKERIQIFEGTVISISGKGDTKTFTVRKIATGAIGVERIWPINSPSIVKIEVKKHGDVRKAKLYYMRKRVGKLASKVKTKSEVNAPK